MAEYWKSAARHWCKQCKVYIRDTPFEKSQHEASAKHQSSLKRFLREIHRDNERQERESGRAQNEVERLKRTVAGGSGRDSGTPPWKNATPAATPAPRVESRPVSLDERKKQMAQLADMGVAIPDEFRRDLSLTGEWQTVSERVIDEGGEKPSGSGLSVGVRKRKHEGDGEEDEDVETKQFVSKSWGSRFREFPAAKGDDEDLDALLESTKDIKTKSSAPAPETKDAEAKDTETKDADAPTKQEGDEETKPVIKEEEPEAPSSSTAPPKEEPSDTTPGVVFKKRKPKAMRK